MPRYLSMVRIDESNAPAEGPSAELMQRMGELIEEMTKAGVLLDTAGLTPTAQGTRVRWENGRDCPSPTARSPSPRRSSAATRSSRPRTRPRRSSGPSGS